MSTNYLLWWFSWSGWISNCARVAADDGARREQCRPYIAAPGQTETEGDFP